MNERLFTSTQSVEADGTAMESSAVLKRGSSREVLLSGPYAIKLPRPDRLDAGRCLNRWEAEVWSVWRPKFGWTCLCPVVWASPDGSVLVMERATQDVSAEEIAAVENNHDHPRPACESKARDWGRLDDGRVVMLDYGYACDNEAAIRHERAYYQRFLGAGAPPAAAGGSPGRS